MFTIEDCKQGNHDLKIIYTKYNGQDEYEMVRWCSICGSIVVDIDIDGRIRPGGIMKMITPEYVKESCND